MADTQVCPYKPRVFSYTARGHNLNFYVGWAKSFPCPPSSNKKSSVYARVQYIVGANLCVRPPYVFALLKLMALKLKLWTPKSLLILFTDWRAFTLTLPTSYWPDIEWERFVFRE
jgi:hypothetical protein